MRNVVFSVILFVLTPHAWAASSLFIEAPYPGASPQQVETAIALPLERSLRGLDGVRRIRSVCTEGRCVLRLEPDGTVERRFLRVEVIHRLQQSQRHLPTMGRPVSALLLPDTDAGMEVVAVWSSDEKDLTQITKRVATHIEPRLGWLPGVARVTAIGAAWPQTRLWLDTDKLAALNLSLPDILPHISPEKRLRAGDLDSIKATVIGSSKGQTIRLGDVCKVESGSNEQESAGVCLRGERNASSFPAVLLLIYPSIGKGDAVRKGLTAVLRTIESNMPRGVAMRRWSVPGQASTLALHLPDVVSRERKARVARVSAERLAKHRGGSATVWFARPQDREVFVLPLPMKEGKDPLADTEMRAAIDSPEAFLRLRKGYDPRGPWPGDGMDLVVHLTREDTTEPKPDRELLELAQRLREETTSVKGIVDASAEPRGQEPVIAFNLDRERAQRLEVSVTDLWDILKMINGRGVYVNDFNSFGRTRQVVVQPDVRFRFNLEAVKSLRLRTRGGTLVPLGSVCTIRMENGAPVIYRVNGQRCAVVSCNLRGMKRQDAVRAVRKLLDATLPRGITAHFEE